MRNPFTFGAFGPLLIRRESFDFGLGLTMRLLYASDLHLGHWWTRRVPEQLVTAVRQMSPDLFLLGGDLVDRLTALPALAACVQALTAIAPVLAIGGNHDSRCGLASVRDGVLAAGGRWLPDDPWQGSIAIDGQLAHRAAATGLRILCAHDPSVFPEAVLAGYDLVLAGHLHGGQCVLATWRDKLYPAAWIHRWHGLRFRSGTATMLVSRGVADTFPFRFHCPREVICCDLR